ncbi:MAG TPA: hypothetical protein VMS65_09055 [Polyangiaceae bacterium]|nr:hypothetical protein [Polyangiaceae bacterium]
MAKVFQTWTTLEHDPIEKHGDNLWSVCGRMPSPSIRRRMTVAKLANGGLVIHNAIALDDASMKELEAFGEPAYLLVPNGFHRQDAFIFKQRYPNLRVLCPRAATKKVGAVVPVDGSFDDLPADPRVQLFHLRGLKEREGALFVQANTGSSATFCDVVMNIPKRGGAFGFLLAPTGRPGIPRFSRWFTVNDRAAFRSHLEELASASDLKSLLVGHGANITDDPGGTLKGLAGELS